MSYRCNGCNRNNLTEADLVTNYRLEDFHGWRAVVDSVTCVCGSDDIEEIEETEQTTPKPPAQKGNESHAR